VGILPAEMKLSTRADTPSPVTAMHQLGAPEWEPSAARASTGTDGG
jgi:hypothetical protein